MSQIKAYSDDCRHPDEFLKLIERMKTGRLKVYLGYAAGVGKTYQMLREAHQLKKRGVDVVLGYVETHNREDTTEQIGDLEIIPRRSYEYRGMKIEEMDVDTIIMRRPEIVVVDEVPHANVSCSKNSFRFQDVLDILAARINVICAFNIQHLESLSDLVERTTGIHVREVIPDVFLKQADQIVTLDISIEDLLDRLQNGKIYAPEKVSWAMEHFFRTENLLSLRELVLREVAESLDRQQVETTIPASLEISNSNKVGEGRVMVCVASASPRSKTLLRRGYRLAGRLNTHWYLVYIETPGESPNRIDSESQRRLGETMETGGELGAEVVRLKSSSPVKAIIDFAKTHHVGHIIVGRSGLPTWKRWFRPSVIEQLIERGEGFDIYVVGFDKD